MTPLLAHEIGPFPDLEPGVVIPLLITAVLYARGSAKNRGQAVLRHTHSPNASEHSWRRKPGYLAPVFRARHQAAFWGGLAVLALALLPPLHPLGEELFSAHMAQHEILMLVAAPLLALSRPSAQLLRGLPLKPRRVIARWFTRPAVHKTWKALTNPFSAWWIHAVALWAWHAPALFQATLHSELIHAAQHLSFFLSALLFWWALFYGGGRQGHGPAVFYVFTTAIHTSILGALLTFAPVVIYPAYAATAPKWGLTALQDQQLGGLIMWVPAGVVYMAAGLALFATWINLARASVLALCIALFLSGCQERNPAAQRGQAAITRYGCGSCHTIGGINSAHGLVGPPLTGIRDRMYVAGMLPNTPAGLTNWIRNPKQVNPRTAMPSLGVTDRDASDIAAYLYSIP